MSDNIKVEYDYSLILKDLEKISQTIDPDPLTLTKKQVLEKNYKFYKRELSDYTRAFDYCPESSSFYEYLLEKIVLINEKIDDYEKLLNEKL